MELNPKQENAIINMENFLEIKNHRLIFSIKKEFDDYFSLLLEKCKKKWDLFKKVSEWKITFNEINKKILNKKIEFYNKEDNLKKYWIKYIEKYFPTIAKLKEQLVKKSKNEELSNIIVLKLSHLIDEEKMIKNKISIESMFWSQNINKIKSKLYNKKFPKDLIKIKINELNEIEWSLIDENIMENKIQKMISKWKSKNEIIFKLKERKEDEEIILKIIEKNYNENILKENILKEYGIFIRKYDKNKSIQKLIWKWFKYKDIIDSINEK